MPQPIFIVPQGRLDASNTRPLEAELAEHLANGNSWLIVDFSETTYISSNGLRILLAAHRQAQGQNGALKLCALNERLREIFTMAGFDRVFQIFETREHAEQAYK